jgi:mannose-1-phosphate guanylyltransferase
MISLHSDHVIRPASEFRAALAVAARVADTTGRLVTIGARPTRAETGYGYIRAGVPLADGAAAEVARFVEKPPLEEAERYVAEGWLWNTGIFVWRVDVLLHEIAAHTPELATLLPLLDRNDVAGFFERAPVLSIDHGLLERSAAVAVLPAAFEWDDVGAWDAVARTREPDAQGNIAVGDAFLEDCHGTIAWSEDGPIVAFGVDDVVIVRANGVTLVVDRARTAQLKDLLASLPANVLDADR